MSKLLVSGLINLETTLQIDTFPIPYDPVRYPFGGVRSTVSGVGYNIATALNVLGESVNLVSLIGDDLIGSMILKRMTEQGLRTDYVLNKLDQTAQSVILFDPSGMRQIHVDLKDIQNQSCPSEVFDQAVDGCSLAVLCNVNFSRPFLEACRQRNIQIATDVHAIASLNDPYNLDFMAAADILFMSAELLPLPVEEWAFQVFERFRTQILAIGMGAQGVFFGVRGDRLFRKIPAVFTRPVVNTIGAGDALLSSFLHAFLKTGDPYLSIQQAVVFASYKIGTTGAADGFLTADDLDRLAKAVSKE